MNREAIFCMLLYSRTEEKMTIKSTEMTLRLSAVPNVALAAGSRVLSAVQALSVLLATVKRNFTGLPPLLLSLPFPWWAFPWTKMLRDPLCFSTTSPTVTASCCNVTCEAVLP